MTTLAANKQRVFSVGGTQNMLPVIASDIIYEGAAVGMVVGTGHCRPLAAGGDARVDARVTGRCGTASSPPSLSWAVGPVDGTPRLTLTTALLVRLIAEPVLLLSSVPRVKVVPLWV